ncbi:MAG: hypothetical protein EON90_09190 [Brevundimonas sp.]|nr:MAG: hypothetical protein EON90_09190 [Brevundimonas sp.]
MSLREIAAVLDGQVFDGGRRALVRAPGHSAADRSVSLLLSEGRVVIHSFGAADWRDVQAHLRDLGLLDADDRPVGSRVCTPDPAPPRPDRLKRITMARRLWDDSRPIMPASPSFMHLRQRVGLEAATPSEALRHHPAAPVSVFGQARLRTPALLAALTDVGGALTAVEMVHLRLDGSVARGLRLPRKTVGALPAGAAVRLHAPGPDLLVGEGVMTVLSAAHRFQLPGWALLSAGALARWTSPDGVRSVVIAADRGIAGEDAAARLEAALRRAGVRVRLALPPIGSGDWNDVATFERRREEGTGRAPA